MLAVCDDPSDSLFILQKIICASLLAMIAGLYETECPPNSSFKIFLTIRRYNAKPICLHKIHDTTGAQLDNQAKLLIFSMSSVNENRYDKE